MTLFHSGLVALTLILGNRDLSVPIFKTDIEFRYTDNETEVASGSDDSRPWELYPVYKEGGTLPLTWLVALFFMLSAFFHLLNATILRKYYLSNLAECLSPTRYTEYTFSAAVMQLLIAYTLGVRERMLIVSAAVLVGITMPFGYWTEMIARPSGPDTWEKPFMVRIFLWVIGYIPQVTAWIIVIWNFYDEDGRLRRISFMLYCGQKWYFSSLSVLSPFINSSKNLNISTEGS